MAFQLAFGHASPGDDEAARNSVASVLARIPYGAWVLAIVGAIVLITGLVFIKRGWTADLERHIDMMDLPPRSWHGYDTAFTLLLKSDSAGSLGMSMQLPSTSNFQPW